jgi:hypothetical protein
MRVVLNIIPAVFFLAFGIYLLMLGFNRIKIPDAVRAENVRKRAGLAKLLGTILVISALFSLVKVIEILLR